MLTSYCVAYKIHKIVLQKHWSQSLMGQSALSDHPIVAVFYSALWGRGEGGFSSLRLKIDIPPNRQAYLLIKIPPPPENKQFSISPKKKKNIEWRFDEIILNIKEVIQFLSVLA